MTNPYQASSQAAAYGTAQELPCRGCGKQLHISAPTCPSCGASQRSRGYKSKGAAAVLAFFFGGFGVHRFYLGQWWGIFYLLTFWTLIPGIISFIEFIVFLVSDQQRWDEKYNEGRPKAPGEGSAVGIIVGVVVGLFVMVFIIGILAAVSIPAYQDYTYRAKVSEALTEVAPLKSKFVEHINQTGDVPYSNQDLNLSQPYELSKGHLVYVTDQGITIEFNTPELNRMNGSTITLTAVYSESMIQWDCKQGTLEAKYRPQACR